MRVRSWIGIGLAVLTLAAGGAALVLNLKTRQVPALVVELEAETGNSIEFRTQNGREIMDKPSEIRSIPHLVLLRNGEKTPAAERSLTIRLADLEVPPGGANLLITVRTQNTDPDRFGIEPVYITAWNMTEFIPNPDRKPQLVERSFSHTFDQYLLENDVAPVRMPTDYFRIEVAVFPASNPKDEPRQFYALDNAFLMEQQAVVSLPAAAEADPGAAPDEMIIFFCDMFPFQLDPFELASRLPRHAVTGYVLNELAAKMLGAYHLQSVDWGMEWHEEWVSYRGNGHPESLTVALTKGGTWYHGQAPSTANAGITLVVNCDEISGYPSLTEALMSMFHHELFHNFQRSLMLAAGGDGNLYGKQGVWAFFAEGTAVMTSSAAMPRVEMLRAVRESAYLSRANAYLTGTEFEENELNISYASLNPYHSALYWRFLYSQCGGMDVIRATLQALYSGEFVDVATSTDLVTVLPLVVSRGLEQAGCPFKSYTESLVGFSRAVYALRLEGGRCVVPGLPVGCGLQDPQEAYNRPEAKRLIFDGQNLRFSDRIAGSYGMDFIEIALPNGAAGQPLELHFSAGQGLETNFEVQVWRLKEATRYDLSEQSIPLTRQPERIQWSGGDAIMSLTFSDPNWEGTDLIGIIVTRSDSADALDRQGEYTLELRPAGGIQMAATTTE